MFVPPDHRRHWLPPKPGRGKPKGGETVLMFLISLFLFALLLAPIGGSSVVLALLALLSR